MIDAANAMALPPMRSTALAASSPRKTNARGAKATQAEPIISSGPGLHAATPPGRSLLVWAQYPVGMIGGSKSQLGIDLPSLQIRDQVLHVGEMFDLLGGRRLVAEVYDPLLVIFESVDECDDAVREI